MKQSTIWKISPHLEYTKPRHQLCLVSVKRSHPKGKVAREREHLSPALVAQGTFGNEIEQEKMRLCKQPQ